MARYAFRRTAAHSVVELGDEEQNPIDAGRPWRILADRTRAECVRWEIKPGFQVFEGRHYGYLHRRSRAVCHRRITADVANETWEIVDRVDGLGSDSLAWRLHLARTEVRIEKRESGFVAALLPGRPAVGIEVTLPPGVEFSVIESDASDRYGTRYTRPCLLAAGQGKLPLEICTRLRIQS